MLLNHFYFLELKYAQLLSITQAMYKKEKNSIVEHNIASPRQLLKIIKI